MCLEKTIFGIDLVKSEFEIGIQILVAPISVDLILEQSQEIDSVSDFIVYGALAVCNLRAEEKYSHQ